MATVTQYNKEFRQMVLRDFNEHHPVEELAEKYKAPAAIIKYWINQDNAESNIATILKETNSSKDSRWDKLKSKIKKIVVNLKTYYGHVLLLSGIVIVIILCASFGDDKEFVPSADPILEISSQVDSITIRSLKIESLLEMQEETVRGISDIGADILVNQEQQSDQLITLIRTSSDIENLCKECLDECDTLK